ncbi:MAG: hypothetical protein RLZZ350_1047 [Verrucomicrobiota bacterium]|jgi:phage FluMu protein Com
MSVEIKCRCQHCDGHIAFDKTQTGALVDCPHCKLETRLFVPQTATPEPPAVKSPASERILLAAETGGATPIEAGLRDIGSAYFAGSILICAVLVLAGFATLIDRASGDSAWQGVLTMLCAVGAVVQGIILKRIFHAAAEALRLLRKISEKK